MTYGSVAADQIQNTTGYSLGAGNASIMKNRIINGAMTISQRYGTSTSLAQTYTVDRWNFQISQASKITYAQNLNSVTPPTGFTNYLGFQTTTAYSIGSGDYFVFNQPIEGYNIADLGWGSSSGKTVTLSFQVYSSLTGTFGGAVQNSAENMSYPFSYTVSSANTWTPISITIPAPTVGSTWLTTNNAGIQVYFSLGTGSGTSGTAGAWGAANYVSATGAVSVVGTLNATFYITGVQLEVGSIATGFEYRQYQQELALCQRYYISAPIYTFVYNAGAYSGVQFPVTMRTAPTVTATPSSGTVSNYAISTMGFTSTNTVLANSAYVASAEL